MRESDERLAAALGDIASRPFQTLIAAWSWKSAAISALLRALIFFATNLRGGRGHAVKAMLVEALFAIFASGFLGAAVQRLRDAQPRWATALIIWLGMPSLMLLAQYALHRASGTQHMRAGLIASFAFASLASGFTWFAMQRGVLLAAKEQSSLASDARQMPNVVLAFVLALPRMLKRR